MKNRSFNRKSLFIGFTVFLFSGFLFSWAGTARLQTGDKKETNAVDEPKVTVTAAKRGNPYFNFEDGRALELGANAAASQPVALVSADFDSDGFADVITADASGALQLMKGIDPANFAFDPTTKEQLKPEPFSAVATEASLGISPDFLFAGDFNADGKRDILGAVKGANGFVVVAGDGTGHFSQPVSVGVGGSISAVESGEIGRPDGQADLAITYSNKNGAFVAVYEHPESAFKHTPEIIKLPSAATSIAIGNTDEDFYSDVAIACGNDLVIIHERGQAYPWDFVKGSGIVRPAPVIDIRRMAFVIASMTVGRFGEKRGTSLALLGTDGNIYHLEAPQTAVSPGAKLAPSMMSELKTGPFEPADSVGRKMAMISQEPNQLDEVDAYGNPTGSGSAGKSITEMLAEKTDKPQSVDLEEVERQNAADAPRKAAMQERVKAAFIRGISAKTSRLAAWEIDQITTDHRFVSMAVDGVKLTRAAVSASPFDDLIVTSPSKSQIGFVSRFHEETGTSIVKNDVIDGNGSILAILPIRLNLDGLSDLIIVRQGASNPEVMMTAPSAVFLVNTTDDEGDCNFGGSCSLRDAIRRANLIGGSSTIYFDLPTSPAIIQPLSPLPAILRPILIQGSHLQNGTKTVEINGDLAGTAVDGLKIRTSNAFIFDLAITGFKSQGINGSQVGGNGIVIESDSAHPNNTGNNLLACFLGIDAVGTTAKPNMAVGLLIFDSDDNFITNTVSSGNNTGIAIEGGNSNSVVGSILGLNAAGTAKVPNVSGMFLGGANNAVGGDYVGASNTISGNGVVSNFSPCIGYGIYVPVLVDPTTFELLTHDNNIAGNKLGTDPTGGIGIGNCWQGISTNPITSTTIGAISETGRNIISGNGWGGVFCEAFYGDAQTEGGFCSIMGNNIGTDITGNISIANDARNDLQISSARGAISVASNYSVSAVGSPGGTTPGGPCTGFCNLVSGNDADNDLAAGIDVGGTGIVGVFNNYVGTKRNGSEALGNGGAGVAMFSTNVAAAAPVYFVGGHTIKDGSLGNLVAANYSFNSGIIANSNGGPGDYHILGNLVGTDVSGTTALPNGFGIQSITYSTNTLEIGDTDPLGRNLIAGNANTGIQVSGYGVKIVNNAIGVNSSAAPLGNGGNGILVSGASTMIGGTDPTTSNIIANNAKVGVRVHGGNAIANPIRGNAIYNNGQLAIDLSVSPYYFDADGVTINDICEKDADSGPNLFQNFPTLFAPTFDQNGNMTVTGSLISRPHKHFTIDIYASQTADPSGHGEGQIYLGSVGVDTDGNGFGEFTYNSIVAVSSGLAISATATDGFGNTSEFSCNAGQSCDGLRGYKDKEEFLNAVPLDCPTSLVVNIDTDQPDQNANDPVCDVDTSNSRLECSLRAALQVVTRQGYVGPKRITFSIPGAGVHTIMVTGSLPDITVPVDLDASTQPGWAGAPLIKLDGINALLASGFKIRSNNTFVKGFSIVRFDRGIEITGGSNNEITSCYIGVNADGATAPSERMVTGILIQDQSSSNIIGGSEETSRNVISNNTSGIQITGGSNNNRVLHNLIGTNRDGLMRLPNDYGIVIDNSGSNFIGEDIAKPNVIAGNNFDGIVLRNNAGANYISGNHIGVAQDETTELGNHGSGVRILSGATTNDIGGSTAAEGNLIGNHTIATDAAGVFVESTAGPFNRIISNRIGMTRVINQGRYSLPNLVGVRVLAGQQSIGKTGGGADAGNMIGYNQTAGILVYGGISELEGTVIVANKIGADGIYDIGNHGNGITLDNNVSNTQIVRNTISGNDGWAIYIDGGLSNKVRSNQVGLNFDGNAHINNTLGGIYIKGNYNSVGGDNVSDRNIISGNGGNGIEIAAGSADNTIKHNRIGTNTNGVAAIENGDNGILLKGEKTTVSTNVISGNHEIGIRIERGTGDPEYQYNRIDYNRIGTDHQALNAIPNKSGILLINGAKLNTISNNVISGNEKNGVSIRRGCNGNFVTDNQIGTDVDVNFAIGNGLYGVSVEGSNNQVNGNHLSGNQAGVFIAKTDSEAGPNDAADNLVFDNRIGTNRNADAAIPNSLAGVVLTGGAHNNRIGRDAITQGNIISGNAGKNGGIGVFIVAEEGVDGHTAEAPHGNKVLGNIIGGDLGAENALGNSTFGVWIISSPDNTIGDNSCGSLCGNEIVGNFSHGISVNGLSSTGNVISYNYVGVSNDAVAIPNGDDGINIDGSPGNTLEYNTSSGNHGNGIVIRNVVASFQKSGNVHLLPLGRIIANHVGVVKLPNGFAKVGNEINGILVENTQNLVIGLNEANALDKLNILAGNAAAGLLIRGQNSSDIKIVDTMIGTVPTGSFAPDRAVKVDFFGNLDGIMLEACQGVEIGGTDKELARLNVIIAGNLRYGINFDGVDVLLNKLFNTLIKENGGAGVILQNGANSNSVGGPATNAGNDINHNGGPGVWVAPTAGNGNITDPNVIYGNAGLGIDLGELGHTPNDPGDADEGPNRLQNYPEITNFAIDGNGDLIVSYFVDSNFNFSDYGFNGLYVEFFKADAGSEGESFLGFNYYTWGDHGTSLANNKTINLGNAAALGFNPGDRITATATDAGGNTSEFFPAFGPSAASVTISGRVLRNDTMGIGKAKLVLVDDGGHSRVALTSPLGYYRFEDVEAGRTYVLTVSHKQFEFANPNRVITLVDKLTEVDFMASP